MKHTKFWIWLMVILTAALVFWRGGTFGVVSDAVCPYEKARVWFNRTVLVRLKALAARSSNAARCAMLEREVERLRLDADRVERLECEVERLRRTVGVSFTGNVRCLPAAVLSRGGTTALWQTMRIGKGASDGIRQGDPVVVPEGVVGRISRTAPHSSEVLLLTDSNSRIAGRLPPQDGTTRSVATGFSASISKARSSPRRRERLGRIRSSGCVRPTSRFSNAIKRLRTARYNWLPSRQRSRECPLS